MSPIRCLLPDKSTDVTSGLFRRGPSAYAGRFRPVMNPIHATGLPPLESRLSRELTVKSLSYPLHVRAVDKTLGMLNGLGLPIGHLDKQGIIDDAVRKAGGTDWGGNEWMEPYDVLLRNAEALPFTHIGRTFARQIFVKAIAHRIGLQKALAEHPEIADIQIKRPIFILGFPRTGTTVLQNMLALNPARRGLRFWELVSPLPGKGDPKKDRARRQRTAKAVLTVSDLMAPEANAIHKVHYDSFEECWYLFSNTFAQLNYDLQTGYAEFGQWILESDITWAYREYKQWLQLLLHQDPTEQLLLKCPEHLWFIEPLLKVFPDACVIWTHRDPVDSVSSYCSLMSLPRRVIYGSIDPTELGSLISSRFHTGVQRAMAARDAHGRPEQFFDVDFLELVNDQTGMVRRICEHFDLDNPPDFFDKVDHYLNRDREDKRGRHAYDGSRYGIDPDAIREEFSDYITRFNVQPS